MALRLRRQCHILHAAPAGGMPIEEIRERIARSRAD